MLVLDDRGKVLAVEFGDMGGRIAGFDGRPETIVGPKGEQFLLHAGQGSPRGCRRLVDKVVLDRVEGRFAVCRNKSHRSDAVRPVVQQQPEIVLIRDAASARLAPAEPAFRRKMLEEGDEAAAPIVVSRLGGKRAGDRFAPIFVVDEARIRTLLAKPAGWTAFERDYGVTVGDGDSRSD